MTYEEAIQHKRALSSETIIENGMTFFAFVTPENHNDFNRYLTEIRGFFGHLTDDVAKKFSNDDQFVVKGLWFNGAIVVHRKL
jgi:hypothetical protein